MSEPKKRAKWGSKYRRKKCREKIQPLTGEPHRQTCLRCGRFTGRSDELFCEYCNRHIRGDTLVPLEHGII